MNPHDRYDRPPVNDPIDRRRFFRQGLSQLLRPIAATVQSFGIQRPSEVSADEPRVLPEGPTLLRPPGALAESEFTSRCTCSGECVRSCPVRCIRIDPTESIGGGKPFIDVDTMPCVVCDGLYCMQACPSGALTPTPMERIDMGTAVWREQTCLRSHGQNCTICVDKCPIGEIAIELNAGKIQVKEDGCIGCGACQHDCPTAPKSIVVQPSGSASA